MDRREATVTILETLCLQRKQFVHETDEEYQHRMNLHDQMLFLFNTKYDSAARYVKNLPVLPAVTGPNGAKLRGGKRALKDLRVDEYMPFLEVGQRFNILYREMTPSEYMCSILKGTQEFDRLRSSHRRAELVELLKIAERLVQDQA